MRSWRSLQLMAGSNVIGWSNMYENNTCMRAQHMYMCSHRKNTMICICQRTSTKEKQKTRALEHYYITHEIRRLVQAVFSPIASYEVRR
jgi:hypothetical protein